MTRRRQRPQKKKEKEKEKLRRTIAKPDASVEWQAERAMLAAREAQVLHSAHAQRRKGVCYAAGCRVDRLFG